MASNTKTDVLAAILTVIVFLLIVAAIYGIFLLIVWLISGVVNWRLSLGLTVAYWFAYVTIRSLILTK